MAKGGKREGAGRKAKPKEPSVVDKGMAAKLIAALHQDPKIGEPLEIQGWRILWYAQDLRVRLDTRKYLYDKRDGKAVHTVNHLHDKPIEMNVTLSLAETIQKARKRLSAKPE